MQSMEAGRVIYLIHYTIHSLISCNFLTNRYSLKFSSFYEFCQLFLFSIEVSWTNIDQFVTPGDYWFSKTIVTFALWHDMTWQNGFLIKIIRINNNRNALYMIVWMLYVSLELCGLAIGIRVRFLMFSNIELNSRIATWETFQRSNDHL